MRVSTARYLAGRAANPAVVVRPAVDGPGCSVGPVLTLGHRTFEDADLLVMAIVNRTRDSFYDGGATFAEDAALERVRWVVAEGADLVDIGGVKAGPARWSTSGGAPPHGRRSWPRSAPSSPTW